jgi:hypothetical protein
VSRQIAKRWWYGAAGIFCLTVAVFFLSTYSKTCQYGSTDVRGQYLCKAPSTADCQLAIDTALTVCGVSAPPQQPSGRVQPPQAIPLPRALFWSPPSYFRPPPTGPKPWFRAARLLH